MADLNSALSVLGRMAYLLDDRVALSAPRRYERVTNDYRDALVNAYREWIRITLRGSANDRSAIQNAADDLARRLTRTSMEHLPYAVTAIGVVDYVPSPAAWRMIADAMEHQNKDIENRLVPDVIEKLQRAITRGLTSGLLPNR